VRLLLRLWHLLPDKVRFAILRAIQKNLPLNRWLMFRHADMKDRAAGGREHLPPPALRYRVTGSPDANDFITVGRVCAGDIQSAVTKVGRELASFTRVLDFGCGCGRTLVHMKSLVPEAQIDGIDIDTRAIEWCKQNLNYASFRVGKATPPSEYVAGTFDFIYVISVFTHLDEDYQFRWLEELQRIATPGGLLVVTVNGLNGEQGKGFLHERSYEKGLFPDWYQNTRHSKDYVLQNFGKYFEVLGYFPKSMNAHQDVVVLQKQI
jgi:SAM-dependent methyltransferase